LRVAAFLLADFRSIICTIVQKIRSSQQYLWAVVLKPEKLSRGFAADPVQQARPHLAQIWGGKRA
jgi:hypothetical protein